MKKNIVISAVNLVEAGTLEILRDCLAYLSQDIAKTHRVVAIVHKKELANYPHIEYIETQWPKKWWVNRLWYEYVSMKKISKELGPVFLWFSLHDTTPTVIAERRAVYCHNSFSFYKWKMRDWLFAPKIAAFALLTKYIYKPNIHKNEYVVVQQNWLREGLSQMFSLDKKKIIVSPPPSPEIQLPDSFLKTSERYQFVFAGSPNSHKNFEVICKAAEILEKQGKGGLFDVFLTVKGDENKYAEWLYKHWGSRLSSVHFMGFISKKELFEYYAQCDCLVYSSKVESWGLPISEFKAFEKPMLLADLPYAKETSGGAQEVSFFDPDEAEDLAGQMGRLIEGDKSFLRPQEQVRLAPPVVYNWSELFTLLLT